MPDRLTLDVWDRESQLLESIAGGVRPNNVGVMEETADGNTISGGIFVNAAAHMIHSARRWPAPAGETVLPEAAGIRFMAAQ